jgi:hypothetical protein
MRYSLMCFCILHFVLVQSQTGYHGEYQAFLNEYVSTSGEVAYSKIRKDQMNRLIGKLTTYIPRSDNSNDSKSHWINLYNAHTIHLIVNHWPIKSIRALDNGNPWDVKRISFQNRLVSLNEIENLIRETYQDPRIHFALNCAAVSCPPLLNKVFTAQNLDELLTSRTRQFLQPYGATDKSGQLTVSKIFEWYHDDFGNVLEFINSYTSTKFPQSTKLIYAEYDWSINGK